MVEKFGLFEIEFTTDSTYNNPYVEVSLSAHVFGPQGIEFNIDGYWYGGNTWRLKIMPTVIGQWAFTTSSNDPGLDSLSATFTCIPSSRSGILMINPDYPYSFKLSEAGPFFWMGETSWCLMSNAVPFTDSTFHRYINKRCDQKFNGIHFVLGTGGLPSGTQNPANEGGHLWISQQEQRINPEFFKWMDKRICYLDSVQMAIGFFITWSQHFMTFSRQEFERFERYLVARYAAYPLLYWVIVGEFDEAGTIGEYNYHGQVIQDRDPYGHLISIHPGHNDQQNLGTNRVFVGQEWFSFIIQQLPQYPIVVSPEKVNKNILKDRVYNMPVVNDEFGYEDRNYYAKIMTSEYVRKYAWSIVLGGGFFSYGHEKTIRRVYLDALETDGITYIENLYNFFRNIDWWEMNPDTDKVDYGFCLAGPSPEYIIYLPDSGEVNIDLTSDPGLFMAQWYNPVDGNFGDTLVISGGSVHSLTSYYQDDAVFHLFPCTRPVIEVTPCSLNFEGMERWINPQSQTITVTNTGGSVLSWSASEDPDVPWLSLHNSGGGSGDQIIVAIDLSNLTIGAYSGNIRISDPNAINDSVDVPVILQVDTLIHITVVSPNGGEVWKVGSNHEIRWESENTTGSVKIQYSFDNGINWTVIDSGIVDNHIYRWTIPNHPSQNCLVKITDVDGEPADQSDSEFTIVEPKSSIFGAVAYWNENRPISEAVLNLTHQQGINSDTTDATGDYYFEAIHEGNIVLVPSKDSDLENSITGLDALSVLKYLALLERLTDDQRFAADVTEDGIVDNSDVRTILNYLVLVKEPGGGTGQWRFRPARSTFYLQADTLVDFKAFVLGDVNGNWYPGGETDQKYFGAGNDVDSTQTVLKISDLTVADQTNISIPISVTDLQDTLYTLIVTVNYDARILRYKSTQKTNLSTQFMIASNGNESGKVHLALAGIEGVREAGEIISLQFLVNQKNFTIKETELKITQAWINDKTVVNIVNGRVYFDAAELMHIPDHFAVFQNHPNPFNPATTIQFDLPYDAEVEIKIFNLLGQQVGTLLNRYLQKGHHQIQWSAENNPGEPLHSGIYFCRLQVKETEIENGKSYLVTKKMFLLK